jgi:sialate O-acetylesterase
MIAPLGPMTLRGVIWYQGESNTDATATHYALLLEALIHDWRRTFRTAELPFGVVQLPGMREPAAEPGVSTVALVREAQADVAARVPGVSLAVTIDVGAATIHPPNKRDVGRRLALHALAGVYGLPVGCEGPIFDRMTREGSALRLFFRNTAGGLTATGTSLQNFAIAGSDRKFAWATARIENDGVVVSSPAVLDPVAVRYAWADAPRDSHLVNGEGLPAAPFRTDDFESGGSDTGRD